MNNTILFLCTFIISLAVFYVIYAYVSNKKAAEKDLKDISKSKTYNRSEYIQTRNIQKGNKHKHK